MKENHQTIYLDNAASTRLDPRVLEKMTPYFLDSYAVATSEFAYSMGIEAKEALESARTELAGYLHAQPGEFVFTSDPTESTNLAILGLVRGTHGPRRGLVTSRIEDFPVLNTFKYLESEGIPVTYLPVDSNGFVDREQLRQAVSEETLLVSIQHANQEIGTLQPIGEFAAITKAQGAYFHTDATHTFRRVPLDMTALPVDLATVASHTLHGPRGIAGLFLREGTPLKNPARRFSGTEPASGNRKRARCRGICPGRPIDDPGRERGDSPPARPFAGRASAQGVPFDLERRPDPASATERQYLLSLRGRRIDHAATGLPRDCGQHRLRLFFQIAGGQPRHAGNWWRSRAGARFHPFHAVAFHHRRAN